MTRLLMVFGLVVISLVAEAHAQERALRSAEGRSVFVIDANRQEWQGRLLKVTAEALEVEDDAGIRTFRLAEIRRVDADGDGVWDGALKGAATGAVLGLLAAAAAGGGGWPIATNALTFGVVGLAIDGGCSARHPVFHGVATPRIAPPTPPGSGALQLSMRMRW